MKWPFENDTQYSIKKLSYAQLKNNRLKKGLSIFAISLATFLISSVLLLLSGIIVVNQNGGNSITGSYHALIPNITHSQFENLSKDIRVESCGLTSHIESLKFNKDRLNVSFSNKDSLALNGLSISEGKMPTKENEILIEKEFLTSQNINAKIGEQITIPFSDKVTNNKFTITGYLKTSTKGTNRSLYAAMVSEKYFDKLNGWNKLSPAVMLKVNSNNLSSSNDIKNLVLSILKDNNMNQSPSFNEAFIKLSQPSILMILSAIVGLAIIIIASVLVIYCIFYISIINSIKSYGQLRTIGMTSKQIKKLINREGNLLAVIAIPIGLILGVVFSYLLIPKGFKFSSLVWISPVVIVLTYITVRISIRKPAKIASTVSPIEASKFESNNQLSYKHNFNKLTPFSLACNQLIRYKKKNLLILLSISLTGVLLIGFSSILSSIDAREMSLSGFKRGQFVIKINDFELRENPLEKIQVNNPLTEEVYKQLKQISGLKKIEIDKHLPASNNLKSNESDAEIIGFYKEDMPLLEKCNNEKSLPKYDALVSKDKIVVGRPSDFEEYFGFKAKIGNIVTLKIFDGNTSRNVDFEIAAVLDESKIENNGDKIDMLILPVDSMNRISDANLIYQYVVKVDNNFENLAEKDIEQILLLNPKLGYNSLSSAISQNENFLQSSKLVLISIIILISCFSIMNLLNTILTGVLVRRKEFALMRSVGMSKSQLFKMVYFETLIVVVSGLVLSVILGGCVGYIVCMILKNSLMSYLNYHFPLMITFIYSLIVIFLSLIISNMSLKHQNELSIIESLR